jgi:hypothetical protein
MSARTSPAASSSTSTGRSPQRPQIEAEACSTDRASADALLLLEQDRFDDQPPPVAAARQTATCRRSQTTGESVRAARASSRRATVTSLSLARPARRRGFRVGEAFADGGRGDQLLLLREAHGGRRGRPRPREA